MSRIQDIKARQVFDSRGFPTVEVELTTSDGVFRASVPAGATAGESEALELRDGDKDKFSGKGVLKAIESVTGEISETIVGMDPTDQEGIDQAMVDLDSGAVPARLSKIGANAVLAVSIAVCRAGAAKKGIPLYKHINALAGNPNLLLPVPCFNMISGGRHAGNALPMQEFLIMPTGADSFAHAMQIGVEVYQTLKRVLKRNYGREAGMVTDEGSFAPKVKDGEEALKLIMEAVKAAGYEDHCQLAVDVTASEFYNPDSKAYDLDYKRKGGMSAPGGVLKPAADILRSYKLYAANFGVASIEDPFFKDDWAAFARMTGELGEVIQILGDDMLSGNRERLESAIEQNACNGFVLKANQIGTVSEAIYTGNVARNAGMGVCVSHRTGDTEDSFIADLAVGLGCGQMKAGPPCRSERVAKYNQLIRVEGDLGDDAAYAGDYWRDPWMMGQNNS